MIINLSPFMRGESTNTKACVLGLSPKKHLYQPYKIFGFQQEEYAEHIALNETIPTTNTVDIDLEAIKAPADDPSSKAINTKHTTDLENKMKEKTTPLIANSISAGVIGLSKGSSKKIEIKVLQMLLVKLGYMTQAVMNTGPGIFGSQTKKSLIAFQQAQHITANGIVNNATFSSLKIAKPRKISQTTTPSPSFYSAKGMIYRINHIPKSKHHRPGFKMTPTTLTIHSTANLNSTAKNERAWLDNPSNNRYASYHVVVDQDNAIECLPFHEVAWHAGDGTSALSGNKTSIGLEICESGNREVTLENAAQLVAKILRDKGWGVNNLRMHFNWSGKNCPRILRDPNSRKESHQTWEWFTDKVELWLAKSKIKP